MDGYVAGPDAPVYVISVAAELTGLHPQTLRGYDRLGLVSPGRAVGGGRRYSLRDIEALREVVRLTAMGIGLEGVRRILELRVETDRLRARVAELEQALVDARLAAEEAGYPTMPPSAQGKAVVVWRSARRR